MEDLLSAYTESQTRRQAETLATQAAEKLGTELETLAYVAHKIEANPEAVGQIMPLIYDEAGNFKDGKAEVVLDGERFFIDGKGQKFSAK
jgi:hypothetical protein